jgi:hypothetical protein
MAILFFQYYITHSIKELSLSEREGGKKLEKILGGNWLLKQYIQNYY